MNIGRDADKDVIKSGATKITTGSGFAAAIVVILTALPPTFEAIFGKGIDAAALTNEKTAILVAAIAGWALIASIDMIARSIVTASAQPRVVPAPVGLSAKRRMGEGDSEYTVAATRLDPGDSGEGKTQFLIVCEDKSAEWVAADDLVFL